MDTLARSKILEAAQSVFPEAVALLKRLIGIPSVNAPPGGSEKAVQEFYHDWLLGTGVNSVIKYPCDIPSFHEHPARLKERDMRGRPNVTAEAGGRGEGRSLLVMAHADTEDAGDASLWDYDPFEGIQIGGRVYGRGAGDDKSGMAAAAVLPLVFREAGLEPAGKLTIASVADEERGGGNGTAALLADGTKADAALYLDGTRDLSFWNAGLGGGFAELKVSAAVPEALDQAVDGIKKAIISEKERIKEKIIKSRSFGRECFDSMSRQFYNISTVFTGPLGANIKFLTDTLPGDDEGEIKQRIESRLRESASPGDIQGISWMSRFLKPAELSAGHPFVSGLKSAFEKAAGRKAVLEGGCQSDQGLVSTYGGMPCVLFGCGRRGKEGAPHLPNEYILLDEFREVLMTTALFTASWCGALNL